jgi:hypothetical protein
MKNKLKGFYLLVSSLVIALLHLPFAFAKSASGVKLFIDPVDASPKTLSNNVVIPAPAPLPAKSVYDSLQLGLSGLSRQAFEKRLYILDIQHYKVLFNTLVAHGRNTGREWATYFSNQPSSYKSSPGFYVTAETYKGNHGYSLKLQGIERGINDNAYDRAIVLHGAGYVSDAFVNAQGYIGRSEGCPAVPEKLSTPIINAIKGGSCLFIYHPSYVDRSVVLN